MAGEIEGTLTRQLLPAWPATMKKNLTRKETMQHYRYVTWTVEPVTYEQADVHRRIGGEAACVVMVQRGPKGVLLMAGWTGAAFITHDMAMMPKKRDFTYHFGWVHLRGRAHARDTMPPIEQWRATLELHAPSEAEVKLWRPGFA